MALPLSVSMLRRQRDEIRDSIAAYEARLAQAQADLAHVLAEDTPERQIERAIREIVVDLSVLGERQYRDRQLDGPPGRTETQQNVCGAQ